MPFKGFIYASVLTAMMIPGVLFTISWILLLSPRAGLINVWAMNLSGLKEAPFDPYGLAGMIFVSGIDDFYTPFLFMTAAFRSMDPSLEEASDGLGGEYVCDVLSRDHATHVARRARRGAADFHPRDRRF